jgi:hypothetical protein
MTAIRVVQTGGETETAGEAVYYPLWFLRVSASWRRLLLPGRTDEILVCVDGVRGVSHRADALPSSLEVEVPESAVIPLKLDEEAAAACARELASWWARARLFSWWAPEIRVSASHLLHKVYIIENGVSGRLLRDSVTGETGAL